MSFEIDISGFENLKQDIEKLGKKAKKLHGTNKVPFDELFPTRFLTRYTDFQDLEDMEDKLEESGFSVETDEDFDSIPEDKLDNFINEHTKFPNWEEMLGTASKKWIEKELGFQGN